ncbi:MAG: helix-turn-helix domain-containing protein [Deltaproteobacteria bacterium]|nr:helix-turn-helix domain-containing protein [Deltaproteobacteria bacterium]
MAELHEYMTTEAAALYLNVSKVHLEQLRARGAGPNFCRPADSRIVRYRRMDLDAWMNSGFRSVYENRGFLQM